jgi:RNA polymerase sigma-70 factor (ECF subfamily)
VRLRELAVTMPDGKPPTEPDDVPEEPEEPEEDIVSDDRLRLMFTCCHPALPLPAQVALTLRTLAGLTTAEIARAFLNPRQVRTWRPGTPSAR